MAAFLGVCPTLHLSFATFRGHESARYLRVWFTLMIQEAACGLVTKAEAAECQ